MLKEAKVKQSSNFDLKNAQVELVATHRHESATMGLRALEEMRVERLAIPASKHGLETICGASCETGAQ
jgi:hypothetical protein